MFFIITLFAIMGLMGTDIFAPSLPSIAQFFHETPNHAQLTISLFLLGFAVSQLFYGPISDRVGRKTPLIIGTLIYLVGSLLCAFTHSFLWLCIGRIIQGIGVGGGLSLSRVMLRDSYQGTTLAIKSSQMAMMVSMTPAVAPFIGGILQQAFGFRATFIFMLAYGLLLLWLLTTKFRETIQHKDKSITVQNVVQHYGKILSNTTFMIYVIIAGFAFSAIILYANIIPFIIQTQLHLSPTINGTIILFSALGLCCGALISSKIVKRVTPERLVVRGLGIFFIIGVLLILTQQFFGTHVFFLMPLIFCITIACGFLFPNALAIAFNSVHAKIGIAGAVYGSVQILISMCISLILNMIPHQNQTLLGIFYVALGFIGLVLLKRKQSR